MMRHNKMLGSASQCIYHALYVSFFCSLLLIMIHSIVNGIYLTTVKTLRNAHYDLRITMPLFDYDEFLIIKKKVENIREIKECVPLGLHHVLLSRDNDLKPIILLTGDSSSKYHLFNSTFYGNRVLYSKNLFSVSVPERATIISANSVFNKKNNILQCNTLSVVPFEAFSLEESYDGTNIIVIDYNAFYNVTEIIPFNTLLLTLSDNNSYEAVIKKCAQVLSIDQKNIIPWFGAYESTCKALALEYWCSIIICFLLFLLISIVIMSLVILFLKVQRRNIIGYVLIGVPIFHIKIIISFFVAFLLMLSCFFGGLVGYSVTSYIHYNKMVSLYLYDVFVVVPFIPSMNIIIIMAGVIAILSFLVSCFYVKKIYDQRSLIINE